MISTISFPLRLSAQARTTADITTTRTELQATVQLVQVPSEADTRMVDMEVVVGTDTLFLNPSPKDIANQTLEAEEQAGY